MTRTSLNNNQRIAQVPKFGDWDRDDSDGSSTYTLIFDKIKADRLNSFKPADDPPPSDGSTPPIKPPSTDPRIPMRKPTTMNGSHDHNDNHNSDLHSRSHSKSTNPPGSEHSEDVKSERKALRPHYLSNSGHHAPKRSTQSPRSHENPISFPKFGDWDIKNPQEYTLIFSKLQQEKKDGSCASPMDKSLPKSARGAPNYEQITPKTPSRWCCFSGTLVRE